MATMNQKQYLKFHHAMCQEAKELSYKKNCDYAGKQAEDPFANFRRCEKLNVCSMEQGFLVRLTDKFSRLCNFVNSGTLEVKDESVRDTCLDIINYIILFYAASTTKDCCNDPGDCDAKSCSSAS